jgi:hypothetical protein
VKRQTKRGDKARTVRFQNASERIEWQTRVKKTPTDMQALLKDRQVGYYSFKTEVRKPSVCVL